MAIFTTKVLIIGSGPAGYSAGIYTARANLNTIMVTGSQPGGQLTITTDVENYPGFANAIQGPWLMEQMNLQAKHVGVDIKIDMITRVDFSSRPFKAYSSEHEYIADSVIISTGAQAKWLGLDSESKFQGYGVSGCATCDGFFYKNKTVCVIGGGNSAVEEALYLTNHASKVYLIHRRDTLKSEKILQDRLFNNPKIEVIWNSKVLEIVGETGILKYVTGVKIENIVDGEIKNINLDGVFVAIGHKPNTDLFKEWVKCDEDGYIVTNPGTTKTTLEGIFAAGDVQDKIYRQAITAAGTGCMAALDVQNFLA